MDKVTLGWINGFIGMLIFSASLPATRMAVLEFDPILLTSARATIAGLLGGGLLFMYRVARPSRADLVPLLITAAAELLTDCSRAAALIEAEPEIVEHMNNDHSDTTRAYAMHLLAQPDGAWSVDGCDPDGLDLAAEIGGKWRDARLHFPQSVTAAGPLRAILKELAEQLRNSEVVKSI